MIETFEISPGVTLRCYPIHKFKQSCFSIQLVQPMHKDTVSANVLIPAILLRGTKHHPDLQRITWHLDDLYGASITALARRIGDYQAVGLHAAFLEDRFALPGEKILAPVMEFLRELLLEPVREDGGFSREFTESEKKNLISAIDAQINDKRSWAAGQLLRTMCAADSFGIPRLGTREQVAALDHRSVYEQYRKLLRTGKVELFYVGSEEPKVVAQLAGSLLRGVERSYCPLPEQTPFCDGGPKEQVCQMEVAQGQLCMGFLTPITNSAPEFAAMQVLNTVFGGGMTSKLFMQVREKKSLCYYVGSGYYAAKGIVTVNAGIDWEKETVTRQEILHQLQLCKDGEITQQELCAAKEAILSGLQSVQDSPGAIESYYGVLNLSAMKLTLEEYMEAVRQVTVAQAVAAAKTLQPHSYWFLKGVEE